MKKKNYNWNLNSDPLSSEQIESHKDFDQLLNSFNETSPEQAPKEPKTGSPLRRKLFRIGGAIAAAVVGVLFFFGIKNSPEVATEATTFKEYASTQPYVNPPLGEEIQAKFASQQVKANEGGVFEFENGSKLTVPPAAFAYGSGGIVNGDVDIRFREYHDFVDFFLSGIPMEYDSAGTTYNLESAGMVEIYAEQDGKRLNMAPGKSIQVELISSVNVKKGAQLPAFNIYYLDTEERNWVYEGPDKMERLGQESMSEMFPMEEEIATDFQKEMNEIKAKQKQEMAKLEASVPTPLAPAKPQKPSGKGKVFGFNFEEDQIDYGTSVPSATQDEIITANNEIQQLRKQYANTMWQVSPKNVNFSKTAAEQVNWDDMELKYDSGQDYELTLIKEEQRMSFFVRPVLTGENYEKAMAEFNKQYAAFQDQITERESLISDRKAKLLEANKEEERIAQLAYDERIAALKAKGLDKQVTDEMIQTKVINRFSARSLGIWNCDRPLPPAMFALKCNFKGSNDTDYNQNIAYLVDKSSNTVARFYTEKGCNMEVNITSENLLWLITKENKIAIYPPEEFKKIKNGKKHVNDRFDHTFVLDLVNQPIETEDDIRKILDF